MQMRGAGGTGFLGTALCLLLAERGHQPMVVRHDAARVPARGITFLQGLAAQPPARQ